MHDHDIEWTPSSLEDMSSLIHEYFQGILPQSGHPVLRIRLIGEAANEREHVGTFDVASARILAGLEAWEPWALVLDLRDLKYEWGDGMEGVLTAAHRWYEPMRPIRQVFAGCGLSPDFPTAVITSPINHEGLTSLVEANPEIGVMLCASSQQAIESLDKILCSIPLV